MSLTWQKLLLGAWLCCCILAAPLWAQTSAPLPTHDVEWWPDMQLNWRLKPQFSLVLFGTVRRGEVNDAAIAKQLGGGFNWALQKHFNLASQYRHVISTPTPGRRTVEERFHIDLTPRTNLLAGLVLTDRARVEWRRLNGELFMRYRNRVQLERPLHLSIGGHERTLTPYASYELYYDTRAQAFSRQQLFFGSRIPLIKHVGLNGFYMRQLDGYSRPGYIHVIASFLQLDF